MEGDVAPRPRGFDIASQAERQPYASRAGKTFLSELCAANGMELETVSNRWNPDNLSSIVKRQGDGAPAKLRVYAGLQLWQMGGVLNALEQEGSLDLSGQEGKRSTRIKELGRMLEDVGIYVGRRLDQIGAINSKFFSSKDSERDRKIEEANQIAQRMGHDLGSHGTKLVSGGKKDQPEARTLSQTEELRVDIFLTTGAILSVEETQAFLTYLASPNKNSKKDNPKFYTLSTMLAPNSVLTTAVQAGVFGQGGDGSVIENYRNKKLAQFFRVAQQSFDLEQKVEDGLVLKSLGQREPWKDDRPAYRRFLDKITKALGRAVEAPERELVHALFERGMRTVKDGLGFDRMQRELAVIEHVDFESISIQDIVAIPETRWFVRLLGTFGFAESDVRNALVGRRNHLRDNLTTVLAWEAGEKTLRKALKIDKRKAELEKVKRTGTVKEIANKEREIADDIQNAVSAFTTDNTTFTASDILKTQTINCVGRSLVGSVFMQEVGISTLVGDVPEHSILLVVPSDGKVEIRDMSFQPDAGHNIQITDKMLASTKQDGSELKTADIVAFSKSSLHEGGLTFDITGKGYRQAFAWLEAGERQYITAYPVEYGLGILSIDSIGHTFLQQGDAEVDNEKKRNLFYEQAVEQYQHAISVNSHYPSPYNGLGNALSYLGRVDEAIVAFREAITINSEYPDPYIGLGNCLDFLGDLEDNNAKKMEFYKQAKASYEKFLSFFQGRDATHPFLRQATEYIDEINQKLS